MAVVCGMRNAPGELIVANSMSDPSIIVSTDSFLASMRTIVATTPPLPGYLYVDTDGRIKSNLPAGARRIALVPDLIGDDAYFMVGA